MMATVVCAKLLALFHIVRMATAVLQVPRMATVFCYRSPVVQSNGGQDVK